MTSQEYKRVIRTIVHNSIRKFYPGLKVKKIAVDNFDIGTDIARSVYNRMYGANVNRNANE